MSGTVEAGMMAQVNLDNALESGRDAVRRHAWREAFEQLTAADQAASLNADDLEGLAEAAWWSGRADMCISARERAYLLHVEAGRDAPRFSHWPWPRVNSNNMPRRSGPPGSIAPNDFSEMNNQASSMATLPVSRR